MPKLIIHHADGSQVKYGLNGKVFTIGRAQNNDIVLPDGSSSNYHAVLKVTDSGDFTVTDLDSTNHTRVHGRVTQSSQLKNGDTVHFGDTMAVYESEFQPVSVPEEPATQVYESNRPPAGRPQAHHGVVRPRGPGPAQPYTVARPGGAGSNYYTATDGCFAILLVGVLGLLAFAGGIWVRHSQDHKGQSFITFVQDVMADRAKAQAPPAK
jgi:hypothetical protein